MKSQSDQKEGNYTYIYIQAAAIIFTEISLKKADMK